MHKPPNMLTRTIRRNEIALIKYLLDKYTGRKNHYRIPDEVREMDDGGMGSLLLNQNEGRRFGRDLIQAQYYDADGTLVIITLVEDNKQELFELDMWKVDFSPLKEFPSPDKLIFESL
jgi:hypothetical protein